MARTCKDGIKGRKNFTTRTMEANSASLSPQELSEKLFHIPHVFPTQQPLPRGRAGSSSPPPTIFEVELKTRVKHNPRKGDHGQGGQNSNHFYLQRQELKGHGGRYLPGRGHQFHRVKTTRICRAMGIKGVLQKRPPEAKVQTLYQSYQAVPGGGPRGGKGRQGESTHRSILYAHGRGKK